MELNLQQRKKALSAKIPEMENTLRVVQFLQQRRLKKLGQPIPASLTGGDGDADEEEDDDDDDDLDGEEEGEEKLKSLFELNDTLYAEAEVDEGDEVGIWLGVSCSPISAGFVGMGQDGSATVAVAGRDIVGLASQ